MTRSNAIARLLTAVMAVMACANASADASFTETIRLVRSMRDDELITEGLRAKAQAELKANKNNKQALCLSKAKYPNLTDAIAYVLSEQLTDAEVAEGIEFYRSPVGQKLVEQKFREVLNKAPAGAASFTAEELAAIGKFSRRSAGQKLMQEPIVKQEAILKKVKERVQLGIDDCLYDMETEPAPEPDNGLTISIPQKCVTAPLASPDNACSAQQAFNIYPPPHAQTSTSIDVFCNGLAHASSLITYKGKVEGIAVRWLGSRALEVSAPRGAVVQMTARPRNVRVQLKEIPPGGKAPQCYPAYNRSDANRVRLDGPDAQPFWMTYGDTERCILSKRMSGPTSVTEKAWVAQFLRVKVNELPYVTQKLVFFESFSASTHAKSVRLRGPGAEAFKLTPGGPLAGFHMVGAPAEELVKKMAAGADFTLEVQPATGEAISVPLSRTDFEWAHQSFASCLRSL